MKLVFFTCLLALAAAAPRPEDDAVVLVDERTDQGDGNYNFRFETSNGIAENREGVPGSMTGSYSFTSPEGELVQVTYLADANGYQPTSDRLPQDHPLPPHVVELLAFVEELVRQGATWDYKGNRLTRRRR